jgi:hypothetical protein
MNTITGREFGLVLEHILLETAVPETGPKWEDIDYRKQHSYTGTLVTTWLDVGIKTGLHSDMIDAVISRLCDVGIIDLTIRVNTAKNQRVGPRQERIFWDTATIIVRLTQEAREAIVDGRLEALVAKTFDTRVKGLNRPTAILNGKTGDFVLTPFGMVVPIEEVKNEDETL